MLDDRDYMRQPEYGEHRWRPNFSFRWSWTTRLIASYVVVQLATLIAIGIWKTRADDFIYTVFALSPEGILHGFVWQLLTYQFMHGGWLHLIFNSWAIYVFGRELEHVLGARRYLALIFSSGVVGGVLQVVLGLLWPDYFGGNVVGASAGAFGLVAAFAMLFPDVELTMLLFFVIPVRLKSRTLLILSAVIALMAVIFPMGGLFQGGARIANGAHLGGMAMGWFYVKKILKNGALIGVGDDEPFFRRKPAKPAKRAGRDADESPDGDVDAILDKISARGINSLTSKERAILEAARKKIAQH